MKTEKIKTLNINVNTSVWILLKIFQQTLFFTLWIIDEERMDEDLYKQLKHLFS